MVWMYRKKIVIKLTHLEILFLDRIPGLSHMKWPGCWVIPSCLVTSISWNGGKGPSLDLITWRIAEMDSQKSIHNSNLWILIKKHLVDIKTQLQGNYELCNLTKDQRQQYVTLFHYSKLYQQSINKLEISFYIIIKTEKQATYL